MSNRKRTSTLAGVAQRRAGAAPEREASLTALMEAVTLDGTASRRSSIQVGIEQLRRGRFQPRRPIPTESVIELADSIREIGLVQPIVVRPHPEEDDTYEILAGERRWRAAQLAGLGEVPVVVRTVDDRLAAAIALAENLQRKDLNPIEEAEGLQRLQQELQISLEKIGRMVGKSRSAMSRTLGLLGLAPGVRELIEDASLEAGHGKVLLNLPGDRQEVLARQAAAHGWSVRELERQKAALGASARPRNRTRTRIDPDIARLQTHVAEQLGSRVRVSHDPRTRRVKMVLDFTDVEEFQGVLGRLGLLPED